MGPEPWSCLFRIADFEFSLQGTARQLRELAECVYSGARIADGKRGRRYRLGRAEGRCVMSSGGKEICSQPALQEFFQDVELALTEEAMWSLDHFLQIHAAAAQVSGQKAVVLIGDHGAGKTTLVVALARLGARIFTDEVALLDPVRLELTPFAAISSSTRRLKPFFPISREDRRRQSSSVLPSTATSRRRRSTHRTVPSRQPWDRCCFPGCSRVRLSRAVPSDLRKRLGDCWPIRSIWVLSRKSVPMSWVGWWRTVRRRNECSATLGKLQRGFCPQ